MRTYIFLYFNFLTGTYLWNTDLVIIFNQNYTVTAESPVKKITAANNFLWDQRIYLFFIYVYNFCFRFFVMSYGEQLTNFKFIIHNIIVVAVCLQLL